MIGTLTIPLDGSRTVVAVLEDDGRWVCAVAPRLEMTLRTLYAVDDYSPADGVFGHKQIAAAAERLGGTVWIEPKVPAPAGTIY